MLLDLIRPHYRALKGYVSAGMEADKSVERIYMNANENPYEIIDIQGAGRYPEPQPQALLDAYANAYGIDQKQIVMTRGADEAIVVITKLFCEPNTDAICIQSPAFGMYGVNAKAMPGKVVDVPLLLDGDQYRLDVNGIINAAHNGANNVKLIYLCSPNNPTANSFAANDIEQICRQCEGKAAIVLDETYIEFSQTEGFSQRLGEFENLIILRTLSKSFSMAGMRMGSLLCANQQLVQLIRSKCLDAYPLPVASVNAALEVLRPDNLEKAAQYRQLLIDERDRITPIIAANSLVDRVFPSDANFVLIQMQRAKEFIAYCESKNLIIRDFSDKPGTQNCIRVSISLPEHNNLFLELLNSFAEQP